jgi:hypothetical protein
MAWWNRVQRLLAGKCVGDWGGRDDHGVADGGAMRLSMVVTRAGTWALRLMMIMMRGASAS